MRSTSTLTSALVVAAVSAAFALAGPAFADPINLAHNGTTDSTPPGSGETNVYLFLDEQGTLFKSFRELDLHALYYQYESGASAALFGEIVFNDTTGTWVGYLLSLQACDFYGFAGGPVPEVDPLTTGGTFTEDKIEFVNFGGVSVSYAGIDRSGPNPLLALLFDDPVDPGEAFGLAFIAQDVGEVDQAFLAYQQPIVPEPATVMLLTLAAVALRRRRRQQPRPAQGQQGPRGGGEGLLPDLSSSR
jgi:hypothetical protein